MESELKDYMEQVAWKASAKDELTKEEHVFTCTEARIKYKVTVEKVQEQ